MRTAASRIHRHRPSSEARPSPIEPSTPWAKATSATVTITVNAASPPTAVDDAFTLPTDFPFIVVLRLECSANDNANGGGPMSATLVVSVSHGTVTLNGDGSFLYSPDPGFSGADSFTYFVANASGSSSIATVSITVSGTSTPQLPSGLRASSIVGNVVTLRWEPPRGGLVPTDYVVEGGLNPGQVLASFSTGSASPIFTIHRADRRVLRAHSRHRWREPQ